MLNTPFAPWPSFTAEEADALQRVLLSNRVNYWTGTECREFEKEFAAWCGVPHSVALANGTLALDVALKALGVGPGDEVVVTPRTFIASISCVVNAGAVPVFADVEPDSGNISSRTIAAVLTPRTKAVICVHLAGWPCDMDPIMALAAQYGLKVIEDCAQAHGARYKGRSVGSIGHVGAWSFCQDKIMTTGGEGGMVTTRDEALWRAMWAFKDHGKSYEAVYEREHPPGFRWLHESFGTNWRMLEMQAVIGRIQLQRMAVWTAKRQAHAKAVAAALGPFVGERGVLHVPNLACGGCAQGCGEGGYKACEQGCVHALYKFYAYVCPQNLAQGWSRDRIIEAFNTEGVPCYQGSCSEVYLEKAFDGSGWRPQERLPMARELGETSLMFLVHPTLTPADMAKTTTAIQKNTERGPSLRQALIQAAIGLPRLSKRALVLVVDISLCVLSVWLAFYLRLGEWVPLLQPGVWQLWLASSLSVAIALPIFVTHGFYRAIFRYAGWAALMTVAKAMLVYGVLYMAVITVMGFEGIPRTIGIIQPVMLLIFVGASRALARYWLGGAYQRQLQKANLPKMLIYGAGDAGRQMAVAMANSPEMRVVGFLDDDERLHGHVLNGQPIYGPDDLPHLVSTVGVVHVLLALPSISRQQRNQILNQLAPYKVQVRTLPNLNDLAHGRVSVSDIKDLDIDDLLGREPVQPNGLLLNANTHGKTVVVTGAGGSIGSELCRQIVRTQPKQLLLVEMSEFALYQIHQELEAVCQGVEVVPLLA